MESLETSWIREVGSVSVRFEGDVGVCCVFRGEVRGEVVEAAVVGLADKGDAAEKFFGGGRCVEGRLVDVAEAPSAKF